MNFPEYNQILKSVRRADALLLGQRRALELLAKRASLVEILHHLVAILEEQYDGLLCSILLVNQQDQTFKAGVDVSDAKNFSLESSGVSFLPPYIGPCCKSAYLGELVVVEDIANDNSWQDRWRDWALSQGLQSCRSHPIFSSTGEILATFALYHKKYHDPVQSCMYQVELTTHIAGIAIERKIIESREAEYREKMQQINCELNHAIKIRDDFLSIASHELNSPLATMKMRTSLEKSFLLKGDWNSENIIRLLESHELQIDRVLNLIRTLADSSSGRSDLKSTFFDLSHLIEEAMDKMSPLLDKAGCVIEYTSCGAVWGFWDQTRLEQVFTNLINNAIKYGGPGTIHINIKHLHDIVRVTVEDNGIGIAPEHHERIFHRYERVEGGSVSGSGLGLGLYLVREIVNAHQGRVYVESDLGQGSKFIVELPCPGPAKEEKNLSIH